MAKKSQFRYSSSKQKQSKTRRVIK
ncbi:MAG: hypothetical protein HeimAB125_07860, partial [Candidatus Heimdallarchaeota archaeon AB_125]